MSKATTREYTIRVKERYAGMRTKRAKGRILDEFCVTTGYERKHAIKVLRSKCLPIRRSGRPAVYGSDVGEALKQVWLVAGQPCSKLMRPVLDLYVASYEHEHGSFTVEVRNGLSLVSPSSMDRLLKPARVEGFRRRRSPTGVAAVKREVPIRAGEWSVTEPGWIEADTVAHCGGNMGGSFVWSLTMTDILTQWTEVRVHWCRGAYATLERIREIEGSLPFPMAGFDSDNGGEFMNWHLYDYCKTRIPAVVMTRSRSYQKNDNAHVEQKNGTHVRALLGHERIDDADCVPALNEAMVMWSTWKNMFCPVMKLVSKVYVGGHRYKKVYDTPRTPAQRVLECKTVPMSVKQGLREQLATTDCFTLKRRIDQKLGDIFSAIHRRQEKESIPSGSCAGTSTLRAAPTGTVPAQDPEANRGRRPFLPSQSTSKQPTRMVSSL